MRSLKKVAEVLFNTAMAEEVNREMLGGATSVRETGNLMRWLIQCNDRWYSLDIANKTLAYSGEWGLVGNFSRELAYVEKSDKYGYINASGELVIPCEYDVAGVDGFRMEITDVNKDGKWGCINTSGELITPCEYDQIFIFTEVPMLVSKDDKHGFIDASGQLIIPCEWDGALLSFKEGFEGVKKNGKWGFINTLGELVIPCEWDWIANFVDDLVLAKKDEKYALINTSGEIVVSNCDSVAHCDGYIAAINDGYLTVYDPDGNIVF